MRCHPMARIPSEWSRKSFDKRLAVENGSLNKLATPVIIIPTEMQIFSGLLSTVFDFDF